MENEQLNLFDIFFKKDRSKNKLLTDLYFNEFDLKFFHSFQDKYKIKGGSKEWWESRWYDFYRFQKEWTCEIQKRLDHFNKVWQKYSCTFRRFPT